MDYTHMNGLTSNQGLTMNYKFFRICTHKGIYYASLSQLNLFHPVAKPKFKFQEGGGGGKIYKQCKRAQTETQKITSVYLL